MDLWVVSADLLRRNLKSWFDHDSLKGLAVQMQMDSDPSFDCTPEIIASITNPDNYMGLHNTRLIDVEDVNNYFTFPYEFLHRNYYKRIPIKISIAYRRKELSSSLESWTSIQVGNSLVLNRVGWVTNISNPIQKNLDHDDRFLLEYFSSLGEREI